MEIGRRDHSALDDELYEGHPHESSDDSVSVVDLVESEVLELLHQHQKYVLLPRVSTQEYMEPERVVQVDVRRVLKCLYLRIVSERLEPWYRHRLLDRRTLRSYNGW